MTMPAQTARTPSWPIAAATVRGLSHLRDGLPNQDAFARWTPADGAPYPVVIALADGHGGARHFRSAVGSRIAVDVTVDILRRAANRVDAATPPERARLAAVELPARIVEAWNASARSHIDAAPIGADDLRKVESLDGAAAAESLRTDPLLAYGATLLAALITEQSIVLLQLGDGDILAVNADGTTRRPIPADERLVGNRTTSICRPGAESDFRGVVLSGRERPSLLLLSTDGYANSFKTDSDFLKVGRDFLALVREQGIAAVEAELHKILEHASTHGSGDDITLAVLQRAENAPEAAAPADRSRGASGERRSGDDDSVAQLTARLDQAQQRVRRLRFAVAGACAAAIVAGSYSVWLQTHGEGERATPGEVATPAHGDAVPKPGRKDEGSKPVRGAQPKPAHDEEPKPAHDDPPNDEPAHGAPAHDADAKPASEAPHASLERVHASRTEKGVAVTATLVLVDATPCNAEATVWDAKDQKLQSASLATRATLAGDSAADAPPADASAGASAAGVPIRLVVPYPEDQARARAMKAKDARVSVALTCGGKNLVVTKKRPIEA